MTSSRPLIYYAPSYLRLIPAFRNALAIARAHHRRRDCTAAVLWSGKHLKNAAGRTGLTETIVEIWGAEAYTHGGFYRPRCEDIVLDMGANVGIFASWLTWLAPGIQVLAFEPFQENLHALQSNLGSSAASVSIYPYAIGGRSGTGCMKAVGQRSLDHQLDSSLRGPVRIITLEEAVALVPETRTIDFLKMDIEGSEADVFEAQPSKEVMRRIKRLAVEWHEHVRPGVLDLLQDRLRPTHHVVHIDHQDPRYGLLHAVVQSL